MSKSVDVEPTNTKLIKTYNNQERKSEYKKYQTSNKYDMIQNLNGGQGLSIFTENIFNKSMYYLFLFWK